MSHLKVKPSGTNGLVGHVTPESAGWTYVGFDLHRLKPGENVSALTEDREVCLVFVTGKGAVAAGGQALGELGGRMSLCAGKPWSVYVPQDSGWAVTATTDLELAACTAPGLKGGVPVRVITPDDLGQEVRGKGSNTRHVTNILPEGEPADSSRWWSRSSRPPATPRATRHTNTIRTTCRRNPIWKRPTTTASTRPKASASSASIRTTGLWTRRWRSRMATLMLAGRRAPDQRTSMSSTGSRCSSTRRIRDFLFYPHASGTAQRHAVSGTACRTMPILEELQRKIDLFVAGGRIVRHNDELFTEVGWLQVLLGQVCVHRGHHPFADRLFASELAESTLKLIRAR